MKKRIFVKILIMALILIFSETADLFSQFQFKTGLIEEDLSKIPWIKKHRSFNKIGALPSSVDLSAYMPPVQSQGAQGSCVCWSLGYYFKTYQEWQEHKWDVNIPSHQFSPAFIYNQINGGIDEGSYFSDALDLLVNHGCATLADAPYNVNDFTSWPSEAAYTNAIPFRCSEAFFIDIHDQDGIDEIRQRLADGNLSVIALRLQDNFTFISQFNNTYCVAEAPGTITAAHAVTIVGYDDNKVTKDGVGAFKCVNSYGTWWGENGYFWLTYQAAVNSDLSQQSAVYTTDLINYTPKILAKLKITHGLRGSVSVQLGLERNESELWSKYYLNHGSGKGKDDWPFPKNNIVIDLTDALGSVDNSKDNSFFIQIYDANDKGAQGSLDYYSVNFIPWNKTQTASGLPKIIPDEGLKTSLKFSQILSINGTIYNQGAGIEGITVKLTGFQTGSTLTDSYGLYSFTNLTEGKNYTITPEQASYTFSPPSITISNLTESKYNQDFTAARGRPGKITLKEPADNSINISLNPSIVWNMSDDATNYWLQVSTVASFSALIYEDSTFGNYFTMLENLPENTNFFWRVRAKNESGWSDWSDTWKFTTLEKPAKVSLQAPANQSTGIQLNPTLSWSLISGAGSYRLQVAVNSSFQALLYDDTTLSLNSATMETLPENTLHFWRVRAKNDAGWSAWSDIWQFTTIGRPGSVSLLSPSDKETGISLNPTLSWNSISGATAYKVQLSLSNSFQSPIYDDSSIVQTSIVIKNLSEYITYFWRVKALNNGGSGEWSLVRQFTTNGRPQTVTLLQPNNQAVKISINPTLSWNTINNANSYRLQVSTNNLFTSFIIQDSTINSGTRSISGLLNNTTFFWKVRAENAIGYGQWSPVWGFTTIAALPIAPLLESPYNNQSAIPVNTKLTWKAVSGSSLYRVQVSKINTFATVTVDDSLTANSKDISNLSNNTKYFWRVYSKNEAGASPWSDIWVFTTIQVTPATPDLISPVNNSTLYFDYRQPKLILSWSPANNAKSYKLQISEKNDFSVIFLDIDTIKTTTFTFNNLKSVKYFWRVKAYNDTVSGSWSSIWSFSPNITSVELLIKPSGVALLQNYPNPFNPSTNINFHLPDACFVTLKLYDMLGREISTLLNENMNAGEYKINFDAANIPGGAYFYKITAGKFSEMKKLIYLK